MKRTSLDKKHIKVLLLESIHPSALETLRAEGYTNVERHDSALPESELTERIRDAHLLGIRSRTKVPATVLAQAERLIAIGCFCIGTDQVDLAAAQQRGVPVFNAPFSNTRSVAELVIGEIILLCRGIPQRNAAAHRGEWLKSVAGATEIRGKTLGIVGYGRIGRAVARRARGFDMEVVHSGRSGGVPLQTLLESCDFVSLHCPLTPATRGLIGEPELRRMRPWAVLVNTARGAIVDTGALLRALREGWIGAAGVDVMDPEPPPADHPLLAAPNLTVVPHIASATHAARERMAALAVDNLLAGLAGRPLPAAAQSG